MYRGLLRGRYDCLMQPQWEAAWMTQGTAVPLTTGDLGRTTSPQSKRRPVLRRKHVTNMLCETAENGKLRQSLFHDIPKQIRSAAYEVYAWLNLMCNIIVHCCCAMLCSSHKHFLRNDVKTEKHRKLVHARFSTSVLPSTVLLRLFPCERTPAASFPRGGSVPG